MSKFPIPNSQFAMDEDPMFHWIRQVPEHWRHAAYLSGGLRLPASYTQPTSMVIAAMGGSAMGGDSLKDVLGGGTKGPVVVSRGYQLPQWVNRSTLLVVVSYSGDTEETLAAFEKGHRRGAKLVCVSSGGKLMKEALRRRLPFLKVPAGFSPRAAFAYNFRVLLEVARQAGWMADLAGEERGVADRLAQLASQCGRPGAGNVADRMARLLARRPTLVLVGEHRLSVGVRWKAQINENAKQAAYAMPLPEMNHNEVVGWGKPTQSHLRQWTLVSLREAGEAKPLAKRFDFTQALWAKAGGKSVEVWATGRTRLERMMSQMYLGDWVSVYAANMNGVAPTPVPVIDWLKNQLRK